MNAYARALKAYLKTDGKTQEALASAINKTQPAVHRYANGRFPNAKTARDIHRATDGAVPFDIWQQEAARRIGLAVAA